MTSGVPALAAKADSAHARWSTLLTLASAAYVWTAIWMAVCALGPSLVGWQPLVVHSDSMAPGIRTGDVVVVSPLPAADDGFRLDAGDVIAFRTEPSGRIVLHRIDSTGDGTYRTKGDANREADSDPVDPEQIVGVARILVPLVGWPTHWMATGRWWMAVLALSSLVLAWAAQRSPAQTGTAVIGRLAVGARRKRRSTPRRSLRRRQIVGVLVIVAGANILPAAHVADASFTGLTDNTTNSYATGGWQIAATAKFTCRNTGSSEGWCWGENANGQIGDGTTTNRLVPTGVTGVLETAGSSLAGGLAHTCVVETGGTVLCWGENADGQIGDGSTTDRLQPVSVVGVGGSGVLDGIVVVDGGESGDYACAADNAGSVFCWGRNAKGQLGNDTTTDSSSPVQVKGVGGTGTLSGIIDLGLGKEHACAVNDSGAVFCWGRNDKGQLGNNTTGDSSTPVQVKGVGGTGTLGGIAAVVAGESHSCAFATSGAVFCWGRNDKGQLGDNTTGDSSTPVQVKGVGGTGTLGSVSGLGAGVKHVCAVRTDGTVVCWGQNNEEQLGDGTSTDSSVPVQVQGVGGTGVLTGAVSTAAGQVHVCVRRSDGTVVCWGRNDKGQLGNGTTTDSSSPVVVSGLGGVGDIGAGTKHSCAVKTDGTMYCWGDNGGGQLGNGTTTVSTTPRQVTGGPAQPMADVLTVAAGLKHSCVSLMDLTVRCWGRNDKGQVGDGTTNDTTIPVVVIGTSGSGQLTGIRQVVAGDEHTCGLRSDTTVVCWGRNDKGQLGNTTTSDSSIPVQVKGVGGTGTLSGVTWMSAGAKHTCVANASGSVFCWGRNASGQLGDSTTTDRSAPVQVNGAGGTGALSAIRQVGVGAEHSCAVSTSSIVYCWGLNNSGQLGDATTTNRSAPVQVKGVGGTGTLSNVRWVDGGKEHTCVTTFAASAVCWGRNDKGQVGDATTTSPRTSPRQVVSTSGTGALSAVSAVAAGSEHSCAIRRDSTTAYCWGRDDKGQLGNNGATGDSSIPVVTAGP